MDSRKMCAKQVANQRTTNHCTYNIGRGFKYPNTMHMEIDNIFDAGTVVCLGMLLLNVVRVVCDGRCSYTFK